MGLRLYIPAFLMVIFCTPSCVTVNQESPPSISKAHKTQHTSITYYPNHQPFDTQLTRNVSKTPTFNTHNYKSTSNTQYLVPKNHRLDENLTVKTKENETTIHKERKKEKFNIQIDETDEDYKPSNHLANKQRNMRNVMINLLKKSENNQNFAAVLPILRVMSPAQRVAMASLVTYQISNEGRNNDMKLSQVKSMFGDNSNATSDLMLPIILDIANLLKSLRNKRKLEKLPQPELLRRSLSTGDDVSFSDIIKIFNANPSSRSIRRMDVIDDDAEDENIGVINNSTQNNEMKTETKTDDKIQETSTNQTADLNNDSSKIVDNSTAENLPVAEELRYAYKIKNGNRNFVRPPRRPVIPPGEHLPPVHPNRRVSTEQRRRLALVEHQKTDPSSKCNLFTESLCLDVSDYPMQAITASIRKNLNVMNALHSDFPDLSADSAMDGISKKQEELYTPEHYLNNINRREDSETRPQDASGFMCPSIVKYARPQKARATSGQWKYIVNTGEHTQTLRLEKCLNPKEPCTFLTDNFKSKCVQVYNYHRLLTWDQQNGLHMDIFKVPTCCSCHIEGYSFAFPPNDAKPIEVTSEAFPGEELIHESSKNRFSFPPVPNQKQVSRETILTAFKNGNTEDYSSLSKLHHYNFPKSERNPPIYQYPSINSNAYDDIYQTQDSNIHIRNVKKPLRDTAADTELPSYLEPPIKISGSYPKIKQPGSGNVYVKRGQIGSHGNILKRPVRKPIRKKISDPVLELDDQDIGASDVYETQGKTNIDATSVTTNIKEPIVIRHSTEKTSAEANEKHFTKINSPEKPNASKEINSINRRVNYNYHPIIDFFEERNNPKKAVDHVASDRIDLSTELNSQEESDWRPVTGPINLNSPLLSSNNHGK